MDILKEVINSCAQLITKVEQLEPSYTQHSNLTKLEDNLQYGGDQTVYAMVLAN